MKELQGINIILWPLALEPNRSSALIIHGYFVLIKVIFLTVTY